MSVDWTKPLIQRGTGHKAKILCNDLKNISGAIRCAVRVFHDDYDELYTVLPTGNCHLYEAHSLDIINAPEEPEEIEVWLVAYPAAFKKKDDRGIDIYFSKEQVYTYQGVNRCARVKVKIRKGQFDE